ncbi:MAG TPA: glycosyltransferase family 4 protein [Pyrinomonadaceae bacterium]
MRIAITADPDLPVPPKHYGGIERIIDTLVIGLMANGHDVTLFANAESTTPCRLEPYQQSNGLLSNLGLVSARIGRGKFDVVHSFGRLAYLLPLLPLSMPKLMSYQREITSRSVTWGERLSRGTLHFAGCSNQLIRTFAARPNWHVVYNGVPVNTYKFQPTVSSDSALVFLGRVEEIKGPHLAIEVARKAGRKLKIAGNIPPEHQDFFARHVAPHLRPGEIDYVGPVDDAQKNELLGNAAALLMPILWDEPFGIVMAEAMACGTPVIGLRRGSVPEVVEHGVDGFVCNSVDEMVACVAQLSSLNREDCRRAMEEKYSDIAMVAAYEKIYRELL